MMRRLQILAIITAIATLAGCGGSAVTKPSETQKIDPNKVGQGKDKTITNMPPPPPLPDGSKAR